HGADERGASIGASVGASVIGATVAGTSVPGARGLRRALLAVMLLGCALGMARRGAAQEPEPPRLSATLSCPPRAGQGRIVCELHLEAPSGHRLRWADALVVEAPEFALPLRARVTASLPEEG